jgi:uncharacterized OB-fold protein
VKTYSKPLPKPSLSSAPFWQAAHQGRLELQYCGNCEQFQHYPRIVCGNCWNEDIEWKTCIGKGSVYSFSICNTPGLPSFRGDAPYVVAIVELVEGVRMTTNIVGCAATAVCIGMQVEAVFEQVTSDCTLVKFRPAANNLIMKGDPDVCTAN